MKKDLVVNVVSYKRPKNNTCDMLMNTLLNWNVYVYQFDENLNTYIKNYGSHVKIIRSMDKPNLALKRQYVLDDSSFNYDYCIMLDDDINNIQVVKNNKLIKKGITYVVKYLYKMLTKNKQYVALSASYNLSDTDDLIADYKNVCNTSIFNLRVFNIYNIKYNSESKCEDMELTMDLILNGAKTGRLEKLIVNCILQGGTENSGLVYRFKNTNRFVEEGSYMQNKYPDYKEIFEYDESHFKMNTKKLRELIGK